MKRNLKFLKGKEGYSSRLRQKQCRRCNEFYLGSKFSKFCYKCKKPTGGGRFNNKK